MAVMAVVMIAMVVMVIMMVMIVVMMTVVVVVVVVVMMIMSDHDGADARAGWVWPTSPRTETGRASATSGKVGHVTGCHEVSRRRYNTAALVML